MDGQMDLVIEVMRCMEPLYRVEVLYGKWRPCMHEYLSRFFVVF